MKTLTMANRHSKPAQTPATKPAAASWSSIAMNHSGRNDRGVIQGAQAS